MDKISVENFPGARATLNMYDDSAGVDFRAKCLNNLVKNCYIFTNIRSVGIEKLKEIVKKKEKERVRYTFYTKTHSETSAEFEDGEYWRIKRPTRCELAGIRWDKCYVDASSVTISQLETIIKPRAASGDAEIIYFNW